MEPTNRQLDLDDERYAFIGTWLDDLIPTIGGAVVACVLGVLVMIAIGLSGCSHQQRAAFVQGWNQNSQAADWNGAVNQSGNRIYDNAGHQTWINSSGQGNSATGPVRVYTDGFGNRRIIDNRGQAHQIR